MGLSMFRQQIFVTKTAGEILFDGYEDPLLDMAKSLPSSATGGAPPVDRFGWFYGVRIAYKFNYAFQFFLILYSVVWLSDLYGNWVLFLKTQLLNGLHLMAHLLVCKSNIIFGSMKNVP